MSGQEQGDFEFQLQAEQLAAESGTGGAWDKIRTYTDPNDGTVYEWDSEKRGWFPKVSSNWCTSKLQTFIAIVADRRDLFGCLSGQLWGG